MLTSQLVLPTSSTQVHRTQRKKKVHLKTSCRNYLSLLSMHNIKLIPNRRKERKKERNHIPSASCSSALLVDENSFFVLLMPLLCLSITKTGFLYVYYPSFFSLKESLKYLSLHTTLKI